MSNDESQSLKVEENDIILPNSPNNNLNISENYQINGDKLPTYIKNEEEIKLNVEKNSHNKTKGNKSYLLYGNHIDNLKPKYLGKSRAFFYINNYPLIIIGPDCKLLYNILYKIIFIKQIVIVYVFYQLLFLYI